MRNDESISDAMNGLDAFRTRSEFFPETGNMPIYRAFENVNGIAPGDADQLIAREDDVFILRKGGKKLKFIRSKKEL